MRNSEWDEILHKKHKLHDNYIQLQTPMYWLFEIRDGKS